MSGYPTVDSSLTVHRLMRRFGGLGRQGTARTRVSSGTPGATLPKRGAPARLLISDTFDGPWVVCAGVRTLSKCPRIVTGTAWGREASLAFPYRQCLGQADRPCYLGSERNADVP